MMKAPNKGKIIFLMAMQNTIVNAMSAKIIYFRF